jgi:hypothetical protein
LNKERRVFISVAFVIAGLDLNQRPLVMGPFEINDARQLPFRRAARLSVGRHLLREVLRGAREIGARTNQGKCGTNSRLPDTHEHKAGIE